MKPNCRILIIEDDPNILIGLEDNLKFEGYDVHSATDGQAGLTMALTKRWDLIILDLMLPERDGLEICKELRKRNEYTPVIMLTAKSENVDKVLGYEIGADDYVTKPFDSRVMLARIKALLRRMKLLGEGSRIEFRFGEFVLLPEKMVLEKRGEEIHLTPYEYGIIRLFLDHPDKVIHRQDIIDYVWGKDVIVSSRTVDTHIAHLRQKIEKNPARPDFIISVRSAGYRFDPGGPI